MRVSNIRTYLVGPTASPDGWSKGKTVLFVKVETDGGIAGWGEAYALRGRERAIEEIILSLGRELIEGLETSPRAFRTNVAVQMASKHPSMDFSCAVSGLEIALWDVAGKSLGVPVHQLLGGALTDRIPLYVNTWSDCPPSPEALAARCRALKEQGYRAVKIYPMKYPSLTQSEECLRQVREAVGPDTEILLDLSVLDDPHQALMAARRFEPYAPFWFEEPLTGEDLDALCDLRAKVDMRIVTGERQSGKHRFREILQKRAADVLNPDIAGCGGILELMEIAAMAEAHSVMVSPHCWNSTTIAFSAMLQVCAMIPNSLPAELFFDYLAFGETLAQCGFEIRDGYATLPQAPGLGVTMNEEVLAAVASERTLSGG